MRKVFQLCTMAMEYGSQELGRKQGSNTALLWQAMRDLDTGKFVPLLPDKRALDIC